MSFATPLLTLSRVMRLGKSHMTRSGVFLTPVYGVNSLDVSVSDEKEFDSRRGYTKRTESFLVSLESFFSV